MDTTNDRDLKELPGESERVFDGRLIRVDRLTVELPDGRTATREVVRHIGAAAIVPVDTDGNVTLVRQFRTPVSRVLLEIPAGKLDAKNEDRLLAAQRELREETGLTARRWTHLVDLVTTPGFCDEVISVYLATELTRGDTDPDEDEFLNVICMPLDEAIARARRGEITDAKTLAGLFLARERLNG